MRSSREEIALHVLKTVRVEDLATIVPTTASVKAIVSNAVETIAYAVASLTPSALTPSAAYLSTALS